MKKILLTFLLIIPSLSLAGHLKSDDLTGKALSCGDWFFYFKKFHADTFVEEKISSDYRLFLEGYTEVKPIENHEFYQEQCEKTNQKMELILLECITLVSKISTTMRLI